jgi:hypothetical protein
VLDKKYAYAFKGDMIVQGYEREAEYLWFLRVS